MVDDDFFDALYLTVNFAWKDYWVNLTFLPSKFITREELH